MKKYLTVMALVLLSILAAGCRKDEKALFENIMQMEETHFTGEELQKREKELKDTIRQYRDTLEKKVDAARNLGVYHKILGKLYLDNGMFLLAAQQFEEALKIDNENPVLFYSTALSYARYGKSLVNESEQFSYILAAEKYYLKALQYNPDLASALYAISVLYVYELDEPDRAVDYLERLLQTQASNYEAMFLLANAYILLGLPDRALDLYDRIIKTTKNNLFKRQAEDNKRTLLDSGYMLN